MQKKIIRDNVFAPFLLLYVVICHRAEDDTPPSSLLVWHPSPPPESGTVSCRSIHRIVRLTATSAVKAFMTERLH